MNFVLIFFLTGFGANLRGYVVLFRANAKTGLVGAPHGSASLFRTRADALLPGPVARPLMPALTGR